MHRMNYEIPGAGRGVALLHRPDRAAFDQVGG